MKITDQELEALEAVETEDQWNEACDRVKRARNGQYPSDWWTRVRLSGLMTRVLKRFGADPEIKVVPIDDVGDLFG